MAVAVGFALAWMAVPTVGKRVFLRVVSAIPTVMRGMTPAAAAVKKAAFGRSKSPALAVKKQLLIEAPPQILLKAPPQPSPREGTEKVPFFYDQNGKCLRFVTSLSANRLK